MNITLPFCKGNGSKELKVNATKNAVLITIFALTQRSGKHYTSPFWWHIQNLLLKYHNVKVKRRWIFQCWRDICDAGLINRLERKAPQIDGRFIQEPGLISFTIQGMKYLVKKRVGGALGLLKQMMKWVKKGDRRWPAEKDIAPECTPAQRKANLERLASIVDALV